MSRTFGDSGENAVRLWLEEHGFLIRACNYKTRYGEIDIIAEKEEVLAFIEVKTRNDDYFELSLVITPGKQRKIIQTAKYYIMEHSVVDKVCRLDVALVHKQPTGFTIEYVPNAFQSSP
jgi:putative endonuclease